MLSVIPTQVGMNRQRLLGKNFQTYIYIASHYGAATSDSEVFTINAEISVEKDSIILMRGGKGK